MCVTWLCYCHQVLLKIDWNDLLIVFFCKLIRIILVLCIQAQINERLKSLFTYFYWLHLTHSSEMQLQLAIYREHFVLFIISQLNCDAFGNVMSRIKAFSWNIVARRGAELIHCSLMSLMDNVGRKLWAIWTVSGKIYDTYNTGNCVFHGDTFYCQGYKLVLVINVYAMVSVDWQ